MTDKQIIKALECITGKSDILCESCAYKTYIYSICGREAAKDALDLINRQKAEIANAQAKIEALHMDYAQLERDILSAEMNADIAYQTGLNTAQDLYAEQIKSEVRTEAIKEFAEFIKNNKKRLFNTMYSDYFFSYKIDEFVKEMTEGKENAQREN